MSTDRSSQKGQAEGFALCLKGLWIFGRGESGRKPEELEDSNRSVFRTARRAGHGRRLEEIRAVLGALLGFGIWKEVGHCAER